MAYEQTAVPVAKSQQKIRELILRNKGTGVAFISQPPMEGFQASVQIEGKAFTIRIQAQARAKKDQEQEERRIWRVLYHHLKSIYEAVNSGVMEFREMMLPYIVTVDGKTVAEHILPKLDAHVLNPTRMLPAPREAVRS